MKRIALIAIHFLTATILLGVACADNPANKLKGNWIDEKGNTLVITDKYFTIDAGIQEDYFIKDDTIYTSFEGNRPYTKYVIRSLGDQKLTLSDPDSAIINFQRK